jgi:hypothetical protein
VPRGLDQPRDRPAQWRRRYRIRKSDYPGCRDAKPQQGDRLRQGGLIYSNNNFLVTGNSITSIGTPKAIAVYDPDCIPVQMHNNTFAGITTIVDPAGCAAY